MIYLSPDIIMVTRWRRGEMGGTCSTHWKDEKCLQIIWW